MSKHFFNDTLDRIDELLKKGSPEDLKAAEKLVKEHKLFAVREDTWEKREFNRLLNDMNNYLYSLGLLEKECISGPVYARELLFQVRGLGAAIVRHSLVIAKMCREDELDVKKELYTIKDAPSH